MLKATGLVRKVDEFGRIILPIELRQSHDIKTKDPLEIYVIDEKIVLKKYQPACILCSNSQGVTNYQDKIICKDCISAIKEADAEDFIQRNL